jgi:hypothetical protein
MKVEIFKLKKKLPARVNIKTHQNFGGRFVKSKNNLDMSVWILRDDSDCMFATEANSFCCDRFANSEIDFL